MAYFGCCGSGNLRESLRALAKETLLTSWELIKIIVPVVIITKILEEVGLIGYLSYALDPVMGLLGLPGELGLVWATALATSLYGAMAIFAGIATGLELSVGQVTVLCSVMLVAHSLPVEMSISKKTGAAFWPIVSLRLLGSVVYGFILNALFLSFNIFQQPANFLFKATSTDQTLPEWALGQLENIGLIVVVIFLILLTVRILKIIGVIALLERLLEPVLPLFGMSKRAAPMTVVGMLLGIGYGGALIIREAVSGELHRKDIFFSMAFLALCHGLIEDTLLMMSLGASLSGILFGRILFALVVVFFMVHFITFCREARKG